MDYFDCDYTCKVGNSYKLSEWDFCVFKQFYQSPESQENPVDIKPEIDCEKNNVSIKLSLGFWAF